MNILIVLLSLGFTFPQMVEIRRPEFAGHVEKKLARSRNTPSSTCEAPSRPLQKSVSEARCTGAAPESKDLDKAAVSSAPPTTPSIKSKKR